MSVTSVFVFIWIKIFFFGMALFWDFSKKINFFFLHEKN